MKQLICYPTIILFASCNTDLGLQMENKASIEGIDHLKSHSLLFLVTLLSALLLTSIILYRIKRKRYESEIEKANNKYSDLLMKFKQSLKDNESLYHRLNKERRDKNEEIQKLRTILSSYTEDINEETWDAEHSLLEHEIVSRMHKIAAKLSVPSSKEWADLEDAIERFIPRFMDYITCQEFDLTEKERYVCILTRLHFMPSEIGILLNASKQRVSNLRSILNKRLFNTNGSKTFDHNIANV